MNHKIFSVFVCLLFASLIASPALAAKDYRAESFNIWIEIQPDASLLVTETLTLQFVGDPFTFVFREIPREKTDTLEIVEVNMDGVPLQPGTGAGQVEVENGDPVKVTWHFAPTSGTHEFGLSYRVRGVILHEYVDTLYWDAIPFTHEYPIDQSLIRVSYPAELTPLRAPTLEGTTAALETGTGMFSFTLPALEPDAGASVFVQFPVGSLVNQPPAWQIEQRQRSAWTAQAMPFGLGVGIVMALLSVGGLRLLAKGFRRETSNQIPLASSFTSPPDKTAPALVARLTGKGTAFLGTLFDLGQRGSLSIQEQPKKWGTRTFEIVRLPQQDSLKPHEQVFLDKLFEKAKNDRVPLSNMSTLAYQTEFAETVDEELTTAGWRDADRVQKRNRLILLLGLGLLVGGGIFFLGLSLRPALNNLQGQIIAWMLIGAGLGLAGVAFISLFWALTISTLTLEGERQAAAWNSFLGHLQQVTRRRVPATPDLFERYLPYAAGFGMATEWGKSFQKMENLPLPIWFEGLQGSLDDGSFAAIFAVISAADSSSSAGGGRWRGRRSGGRVKRRGLVIPTNGVP